MIRCPMTTRRHQRLFALVMAGALLAGEARAVDGDSDGVEDSQDNCTQHYNPLQIDADCDTYGNACDPDFNNDGVVDGTDFGLWLPLGSTDPRKDMAPPFNGVSDTADYDRLVEFFGTSVGPTGVTVPVGPSCTGVTLATPYYCIKGEGTGVAYDWAFINISPPFGFGVSDVPPAPSGSGHYTLMLNFQSSIEESRFPNRTVTGVAFYSGKSCFSLATPVTLGVRTSAVGGPMCIVDSAAGCSYNPTIYQVLTSEVPSLTLPGLGALGLLMGGFGGFRAIRRRKVI